MSAAAASVTVTELFIYPLKSAGGIPMAALDLDDRGPIGDRRWMLVDEHAEFLSQRRLPRMALLRISLDVESLTVAAPGMPTLTVPRSAPCDNQFPARVWDDTVMASRVSADADTWFSTFLHHECALVALPDGATRLIDPHYSPSPRLVGFADGFPLLVVGSGSLDEVNRRLAAQGMPAVGMDRFRPNVVVSAPAPHAEDGWHRLVGNEVTLEIVKPCARCTIVATDQERGVRVVEPLRTLTKYRRDGSKVMFGQNAIHDRPGRIGRGDVMRIDQR